MKVENQITLYAINIAITLCLEIKTSVFKPFRYNNLKELKFSLTFESMYLIESYKTNNPAFSLTKCLSKSSKNVITQAISYEVDKNLAKTCKSYSESNFQPTDVVVSINSMILIRFSQNVSHSINQNFNYNCKEKILKILFLVVVIKNYFFYFGGLHKNELRA